LLREDVMIAADALVEAKEAQELKKVSEPDARIVATREKPA
jgi:hypothetical protein